MILAVTVVLVILAILTAAWWNRRDRNRRLLEAHTILPEDLHRVLSRNEGRKLRVYDVRQPLDLLAHSEIIPGSERITPREIRANPSLIPADEDVVVYCTCPGDKTAIDIVKTALSLKFVTVRILKGGLEGWKEKGYPVEQYVTAFHLDTPA